MPKSQDDKWRADQVNATIHDFVAEGIIVDDVVAIVVLCILSNVFKNWRKNITLNDFPTRLMILYIYMYLDSVKRLLSSKNY